MTVRECYEMLGADYEGVVRRMVTEERVRKFVVKLPQDKSFAKLSEAMEKGDAQAAFMGVHTLKGIAMNFGLTGIEENASTLTEELRGGKITPEAARLFAELKLSYMETIKLIGMLSEQGGNAGEQ